MIVLSQVFGFFPVFRAGSKLNELMTAKWKAFKAIFSTIWFASAVFITFGELRKLLKKDKIETQDLGWYFRGLQPLALN